MCSDDHPDPAVLEQQFQKTVERTKGLWLAPSGLNDVVKQAQNTISNTNSALRARVAEVAKTKEERDAANAHLASTTEALDHTKQQLSHTRDQLAGESTRAATAEDARARASAALGMTEELLSKLKADEAPKKPKEETKGVLTRMSSSSTLTEICPPSSFTVTFAPFTPFCAPRGGLYLP